MQGLTGAQMVAVVVVLCAIIIIAGVCGQPAPAMHHGELVALPRGVSIYEKDGVMIVCSELRAIGTLCVPAR